ncbi:AraC family transcriptional regulator [Thioclava sp. L04-15]|uniref:acetamidase/formamidase family protein n=1 Tax=Thioclava sp. L04-15 TaxID=1915318 RepID=UPI0009970958|nr:acetamidase/formamidase family protein [Thioclava sp. L04-15]OOY28094.1 AraC family transcriptional regulator [Thioclava sp. L04-15]TNE83224.1 MAG: helix-turn-helix domain-containing protein [Paracoccaceae bacterium]
MPVSRFQSESYSNDQRDLAWREFLDAIGLLEVWSPEILPASLGNYRSGLAHGKMPDLMLARLSATGRELSPIARRGVAPLIVLPLDEAIEIVRGDEGIVVRGRELGLVPTDPGWHIRFGRNSRTVCLTLPEALLLGRRSTNTGLAAPRVFPNESIVSIFAAAIEATAAEMERLHGADWAAVAQQLTDLFFCLPRKAGSDVAQRLAFSGLLGRVAQTIESHLGDNDLNAKTVAQMEGISERYMQRLFKRNGETFSQYLRERRLQRARALLSSPGEPDFSVANVAYDCGFGDAANFNRLFKQRFGQPPGAFRASITEARRESAGGVENRGWPISALGRFQPRATLARPARRLLPAKPSNSTAQPGQTHHLNVGPDTVHWGYFSRSLAPVLSVRPGDHVIVETLTQHATDARELMIKGDPAAEEVFFWDGERKGVDRRGAGPQDASVFGRGAGEGFGVHICTGPIHVEGAEPGDVVEVHIDDMTPRPSRAPGYEGRVFGSTVSAWWGYHYSDLLTAPNPRETVTIYEVHQDDDGSGHAEMLYSYRWKPQTDPFGVTHATYDYPGIPVKSGSVEFEPPPDPPLRVPLRPHFGVIAVAPREANLIDSVPPAYFGGNIDNWRLGKGTSVYLPVSVRGALLSIGDPHAAQGDGELSGTAIECSMTGRVTIRLHKRGTPIADITYPLIETADAWVLTGFSHPDYLAEFGSKGQSEVYAKSSLDLAMRDAFRKARRFLMARFGLAEDQAIAHISAAVDFGVTQVVDGNLGVHAIIPKSLVPGCKE